MLKYHKMLFAAGGGLALLFLLAFSRYNLPAHPNSGLPRVFNLSAPVTANSHHLDANFSAGTCELHPRHLARYAPLSHTQSASKIYLALNLINAAGVLPNFILQLPVLLRFLGPDRVHISIYENGSKDETPHLLRDLANVLDELGTSYSIVAKGTSLPAADMYKMNARIPVLAYVRNAALQDLVATAHNFDTVLFMNDVIWCPADILELLLQKQEQGADMVCGMDWESHIIWDRWVLRSMSGSSFYTQSDLATYFYGILRLFHRPIPSFLSTEPQLQRRFAANLPIQVFSCWNGMAALSASAFLPPHDVRFRTALNDRPELGIETDKESECFLICVDFWKAGFYKIMTTRRASVAYEVSDYNEVRQDRDASLMPFEESERISWSSTPPREVAYHDWSEWMQERWGSWDEA
ncbi:glycosyltransferase family 69 protein [Ramaria rubella]|nr:glycosyltransferase family 69 protein [Ramaria rubella]